MSKIDREARRRALKEDYNNRGKSDRNWYLVDSDELEETFRIKSFTPAEGNIFLGILERWEDPKFFLELFVHYNIGSDNHAFLCLDKMFGENCPICALRNELKNAGEPEDIYKEYSWTRRYLIWVVNMESKRTIKEGVMLYDAPATIKNAILDACLDPRTQEIFDISDPDEKVNFVFKRTGKTKTNTKYTAFNIEEREDEIPKEYYDLPEMKELIIKPEISEIRKILGVSSREEPEDDIRKKSKFTKRHEERTEEEDSPRRKLKPIAQKEEVQEEEGEDDDLFDRKKYQRDKIREESDNENEEEEKREILERTRRRLRK